MIIDTHCHLDIKDYDNLEEVIKNMEGNYMIASGYNLESNKHVIELVNKYDNIQTAMQSLGYKEVVEYFNNEITKEEMVEKIKMESRRYAKRQLTWFRKNKEIIWIDGLNEQQDNIDKIIKNL